MTLATSSSVHQAEHQRADRLVDLRRDAERARFGVPKTVVPSDVLPNGFHDLTPESMSDRASTRFNRRFARLIPAGLVWLRIT
jgi:hypothetical protein